jgi:hypothetical protein
MRAYVVATGVIFGLLTVIHIWRMIEEPHLVREPIFILVTAGAAALSIVAWSIARRSKA